MGGGLVFFGWRFLIKNCLLALNIWYSLVIYEGCGTGYYTTALRKWALYK